MAKVLLIEPDDDLKNRLFEEERLNTPLNLVYLATAIKDKHQVKIFDRNLHREDLEYIQMLKGRACTSIPAQTPVILKSLS